MFPKFREHHFGFDFLIILRIHQLWQKKMILYNFNIYRNYTIKMGYDSDECFECYHNGGGSNTCEEDGTHCDTCLRCIDDICGSDTTMRVTIALKQWGWNSDGRCTRCCKSGITIGVLLCSDHAKSRKDPDAELEAFGHDGYDCYLCDYEGERHYEEDEIDELVKYYEHCDTCLSEITEQCGNPGIHESSKHWAGYISTCKRCGKKGAVLDSPLCNYHKEIIK